MKIKEFVNEFVAKKVTNSKANQNAVVEFINKNVEFKTYLTFAEKRELCKNVLEAACSLNGNIIEVDSVSRYLLFTIEMISRYTNLEFENNDDGDAIDQYDMLCANGLLNYILDIIGEEYDVCNNILNMMLADIIANNNNASIIIDKAAQQLLNTIDGFIDVLADKVKSLNLDLNQIEKYRGLIEKFIK